MKRLLTLALALAMTLSLASCKSDGNETSTDSNSEFKNEVVVAVKDDTDTFDPQVANGATADGLMLLLYSPLLQFDEKGNAQPHIVTEWTTSEDQNTWTFKIRDDVKFHNGKQMTAHDIKATLDRALYSEGGLKTTATIEMFEKVEAPEDYVFTVTTKEPYGAMLSLLCNLWVMDSEMIEKYGMDIGKKPEAVNGTGPYKLSSWEPDQEILVEGFDDYFIKELVPKTKYVRHVVIPEAASQVIALETGEIDIAKIPSDEIERFRSLEGFKLLEESGNGQRCFRFGCNDEIMKNTKVRQAIVHAIDRKSINQTVFNGMAQECTSPFTPAIWGYCNLGEIEQDLELSKKLLEEAGYPDGFDTKIVTTDHYAKGTQLAEVISHQLKEIGINAKIEVLEWSAFLSMINGITEEELDAPIFIMGTGPSSRDQDTSVRNLYGTSPNGLNDMNYGFYSNPKVDELGQKQMTQTNPEERKATLKEINQIIYLDDPAAFWIHDQIKNMGMSDKVEGAKMDVAGYVIPMEITVKR